MCAPLARLQRVTFPGTSGGVALGLALASFGRGSRPQIDGFPPLQCSGRQDDRALEDVFQFAHVAGPVISGQPVQNEVGDPSDPTALAMVCDERITFVAVTPASFTGSAFLGQLLDKMGFEALLNDDN